MPRPISRVFLCTFTLVAGAAQAQGKASTGTPALRQQINAVLLTPGEISALPRDPAHFTALLASCVARMNRQPAPSAVFGPDPHYTSTGLNASTNNAKALAADADTAYRAALCYLVSGDGRDAAQAQQILDAWAGTLKTVSTSQGRADINFNFPSMILAASWVRGASNWNSGPFDTFLKTTILPQSEASFPNNHGLWGVLLEASAGAYLGDHQLLSAARTRWAALMRASVNPDGSMPHEMQRSDTTDWTGGPGKGVKGIAYTHYALLPASLAAKIFAVQGQPVWHTHGGRLLQAAFGRAAAWTLHPETFPYFASNGGKLEGVRNAAYFTLLLKTYPDADAQAVLRQGQVGMNGLLLTQLFGSR